MSLPRKLVGICVASALPMACALPKMDADFSGDSSAGQASGGLGGSSAGVGSGANRSAMGGTIAAPGTSISGSAGRNQTSALNGGSSADLPTAGGAFVGEGGSNVAGAFAVGGAQNVGTSLVAAGASGIGGTYGLGGASVASAGNATGGNSTTGGLSGTATIGPNSAGASGTATTNASGGSAVAGSGAIAGGSATGGWGNAAGAANTPLSATKVTTGFFSSCAVKEDGTAYCWGSEYCGALGNDSDGGKQCGLTGWFLYEDFLKATLRHSAVKVQGITNAVAIARGVGNMHNCVVKRGGTVSCWGYDTNGQLGNGTTEPCVTSPTTVRDLSNVASVVLGFDHSCALLTDATVKCWGANDSGAIGNGGTCSGSNCSVLVPTAVLVASGTPLDHVRNIYSGEYHTCALKTDGTVWCWGYNNQGQLGNGTADDSPYAIQSKFPPALDVTTGARFTCIRDASNTLWCAGNNDYGGFGIAAPDPVAPIPTPIKTVTFSSEPVALTAGTYNTCAIVASVEGISNVAQCWGDNYYGQLGNGTRDASLQPVTALGLSNVTDISADENHTCATMAGSVYCWGDNTGAQVGTAGNGRVVEPTKVDGF